MWLTCGIKAFILEHALRSRHELGTGTAVFMHHPVSSPNRTGGHFYDTRFINTEAQRD